MALFLSITGPFRIFFIAQIKYYPHHSVLFQKQMNVLNGLKIAKI